MEMKKGALYLVGTPIGNLEDFSPRAQFVLKNVDLIAAEDTRVTGKLLMLFGISTPMISYHEHNKTSQGEKITARLLAGETCALVSDAGMPAISDPGEALVKSCHEKGINVCVIPGPSAGVCAVAASGLFTGRFTFEGFLSVSNKKRNAHLESIKNEERTMVFYEAPHKLRRTLRDLLGILGNRRVTVSREITKMHEEITYTTLEQALSEVRQNDPRGEFVLVVEGREKEIISNELDLEEIKEEMDELIASGMKRKDAAAVLAEKTGLKKSELYSMSLSSEQI